jgi:predicted nucleic acid-binding protein
LTSTFDLESLLRRVKPSKRTGPLRRRLGLHFVRDDIAPADVGPVFLDTCVYVDAGKGKLPRGAQRLIATSILFHSSVCIAEMSYAFGRLDPTHPDTPATLEFMRETLSRVRIDRTVAPNREAYLEAGIITGTLVRTQSLAPPERRKLMHDVLVFLTARQLGYAVLTANVKDFDLIQQLARDGNVIYYRPADKGDPRRSSDSAPTR